MDNDVFMELKKFIENERWKYKFPLTRETKLVQDLNIYGDDSVRFILAYGKYFNVDVTNFMAADYFDDEGYDVIGSIKEFLKLKTKTTVKKTRKTLNLGHLEKGIIKGRLDEEVIAEI